MRFWRFNNFQEPIQDEYSLIIKFQKALWGFYPLILCVASALFLARIYEFSFFYYYKNVQIDFDLLKHAMLNDVLFLSKFICTGFLLYFLLVVVHTNLAKIVAYFIGTAILIISISLSVYFAKSMLPLGKDAFAYSLVDIKETLFNAGFLNAYSLAAFLFAFLFSLFLYRLFFSFTVNATFLALLYISALLLFIADVSAGKVYNNELKQNLALCKSAYFAKSGSELLHFKYLPEIESNNIQVAASDLPKANWQNPTDKNFPFAQPANSYNPLQAFFSDTLSKPNIVFIIVESLGKAYSGKGAYIASFTPFLDSLSAHSLYWDHCISSAGRTFGVLPAVLASLPPVVGGIMELPKIPKHQSLISLSAAGYSANFFYGGNANFDGMKSFLQGENVGIHQQSEMPASYERLPAENGFSWGYTDRAVFDNYLQSQSDTSAASINVFLTLANHSPFLVPNQQKYLKSTAAILQALAEQKQKEYLPYQQQLSCVMYTDDAIRSFIKDYSKRKDFKSTIFVITGDHRMPEIPLASKIDRYHVPLIIYSPALTRHAIFHATASHYDLAPSLLNLIRNKDQNKENAFMSEGLDTSRVQVFNKVIPLMPNKGEISELIAGRYFYSSNTDQVFMLGKNLESEAITDEKNKNNLKQILKNYIQKSKQSVAKGTFLRQ